MATSDLAPPRGLLHSANAGAQVSAFHLVLEGVLAFLSARGYPDAQAVHTAEESLIFALPPELRRDLRKAAAGKTE